MINKQTAPYPGAFFLTCMEKLVEDLTLIAKEQPEKGNYILHFTSPVNIPQILAGNFAELKVPESPEVFLRRPFSILDIDYEKRAVSFYIKAIGKGTEKLGSLQIGSKVNCIFPLGNCFAIEPSLKNVLIVGGGSGIAPFILLGRQLRKQNIKVVFLLGGRSRKDILLKDTFSEFGEVLVTTEDGSLGEKGLVTQHSVFKQINQFDKIFTCGPNPMMKAVGLLAQKNKINCEASLENMMACGFGVCLCCVTATNEGNKRVCNEGPVFNVNRLKW